MDDLKGGLLLPFVAPDNLNEQKTAGEKAGRSCHSMSFIDLIIFVAIVGVLVATLIPGSPFYLTIAIMMCIVIPIIVVWILLYVGGGKR